MKTVEQTMDRLRRALPLRMGKNRVLVGPEYAGCCGTGRRAKMVKTSDGQFVVGHELDFDYDMSKLRWLKTYAGAKNVFLKHCRRVVEFNHNVAVESEQARRTLRESDDYGKRIGAVLVLSDNGTM